MDVKREQTIGDRIRSARGERTRREISDASGLSEATIYQVETGRATPDLDTLVKLARALGVRAGDLIDAAGE